MIGKKGCLSSLTKKIVWLIILLLAIIWFFFYGGKKELLQYFYPIKYEEYVEKYSNEYGINKCLVYAVINTESEFEPSAVSDAGAVGLMQLMEETAIEYNEKGDFGYNIPEELKDPEVNIRIGCCYLSYLIDRYEEDLETALAAYNAGIGNVEVWLGDRQYLKENGGLETTPYKETNEYVEKVMKNYEKYREIY